MKTSSEQRIKNLRASGHWGDDTLHGLLDKHAANKAKSLAVKDQPNRKELTGDESLALNWQQLQHASINLAVQLQGRGVVEGDTVVVQLPNVVELLVLYYAASRLGVIVSPVPVQYGSHELRKLSAALNPKAIISLPSLRGAELAATAGAALPDVPLLVFGTDLNIDTSTQSGALTQAPADADRIVSICWTSGTTGTPKGVPRSHNMWLATARCSIAAGAMHSDDIMLNPFPLVNMAALGGFLFPAAWLGAAIVLHQPLEPGVFLAQMQNEKITFTIAPPALLNQLAKSPEMWEQFDFSALRRIGSGSAPLAPSMIATFGEQYHKEIINFYGSNEGIALFATPEDAPEAEVRASMFAQPEAGSAIETKVVDVSSGESLTNVGDRGELLITGATVFDGYFTAGNETPADEVFDKDGYFRTGDLVEICGEKGQYCRIVGRSKDIINRGGMKISPVELDVALEHHPAVVEAAVCAYADERLGEKICACLVLQPDVDAPSLEEIQDFLLEQGFARFKLPERIEWMVQLPRNPLGKVQRFSLQDAVSDSDINKNEKA